MDRLKSGEHWKSPKASATGSKLGKSLPKLETTGTASGANLTETTSLTDKLHGHCKLFEEKLTVTAHFVPENLSKIKVKRSKNAQPVQNPKLLDRLDRLTLRFTAWDSILAKNIENSLQPVQPVQRRYKHTRCKPKLILVQEIPATPNFKLQEGLMATVFNCPNCNAALSLSVSGQGSRQQNRNSNGASGQQRQKANGPRIKFHAGNFQAMGNKAKSLGGTYDGKTNCWTMPDQNSMNNLTAALAKYEENRYEIFSS